MVINAVKNGKPGKGLEADREHFRREVCAASAAETAALTPTRRHGSRPKS